MATAYFMSSLVEIVINTMYYFINLWILFLWLYQELLECRNFIRRYYRQTGCSFADNFATSHRNIGILIDSLLGAVCKLKFKFALPSCDLSPNKFRFSFFSKRHDFLYFTCNGRNTSSVIKAG